MSQHDDSQAMHIAFGRKTSGSLSFWVLYVNGRLHYTLGDSVSEDPSGYSNQRFSFGRTGSGTANPTPAIYNRARLYLDSCLSDFAVMELYTQGMQNVTA